MKNGSLNLLGESSRAGGAKKSGSSTLGDRLKIASSHTARALLKELRSELEKSKLDKEWSAVGVFAWLKRKELEHDL